MVSLVSRINPCTKCIECSHFIRLDDPSWYIDSFHYDCYAQTSVNEYGDKFGKRIIPDLIAEQISDLKRIEYV